jgi:hypothetical protein
MRGTWRVWRWTTAILVLYFAAGYIESHFVETPIRLEAGYATSVNIVRLADDPLLMSLVFPKSNIARPELGFPETARPWPASEEKRYLRPGSAIRLRAAAGSQTVFYEAEPAYAHGANSRSLTSHVSIAPGVWRWPPPLDLQKQVPRPGVRELCMEIFSVKVYMAGVAARFLM